MSVASATKRRNSNGTNKEGIIPSRTPSSASRDARESVALSKSGSTLKMPSCCGILPFQNWCLWQQIGFRSTTKGNTWVMFVFVAWISVCLASTSHDLHLDRSAREFSRHLKDMGSVSVMAVRFSKSSRWHKLCCKNVTKICFGYLETEHDNSVCTKLAQKVSPRDQSGSWKSTRLQLTP